MNRKITRIEAPSGRLEEQLRRVERYREERRRERLELAFKGATITLSVAAALILILLLAGCANYLTTREMESLASDVDYARSGVRQSKEQLEKLNRQHAENQRSLVPQEEGLMEWSQADILETRSDVDHNEREADRFLNQLGNVDLILDRVERRFKEGSNP